MHHIYNEEATGHLGDAFLFSYSRSWNKVVSLETYADSCVASNTPTMPHLRGGRSSKFYIPINVVLIDKSPHKV